MQSPYEMFKTNKDVETAGVFIDYGSFKIKVARAGGSNTKYNKLLDRETKSFRRQIQTNTIDPEVLDSILRNVFAKAVVLGWEGVVDPQGNPMQFTVENCIKLFEDLPDLFTDLRDQAANYSLFRENIEDDVKN